VANACSGGAWDLKEAVPALPVMRTRFPWGSAVVGRVEVIPVDPELLGFAKAIQQDNRAFVAIVHDKREHSVWC